MATGPIQNNGPVGNLTSQTDRTDKSEKAASNEAKVVDSNARGVNPGAADVAISNKARERSKDYQSALDIARGTPDIREDRVAELKAQIAAGTYKIDSGNIADGIMREAIRDHLALND